MSFLSPSPLTRFGRSRRSSAIGQSLLSHPRSNRVFPPPGTHSEGVASKPKKRCTVYGDPNKKSAVITKNGDTKFSSMLEKLSVREIVRNLCSRDNRHDGVLTPTRNRVVLLGAGAVSR